MLRRISLIAAVAIAVCPGAWAANASKSQSQAKPRHRTSPSAFVPGSGTEIPYAGDDFESAEWNYIFRGPKSSREQDKQLRGPMGESRNDRWHEGPERGDPDQIEVVPTPPGGLPGSEHALLMRTLKSGIPGYVTGETQQDDLISNMLNRIGSIPVGERPSVVVRVWLPPADKWEQRQGPHFGFRTSASTITEKKAGGLFFLSSEKEAEPYWPGMWIHFRPAIANSKDPKKNRPASAYLAVRGDRLGRDYHARELSFGWWTLGMSYTGDGQVHYYASPGVDPLTAEDYLSSEWPYSYTARQFRTYFFDVCNHDDGRTWSTPFIVDDPQLYVVNAGRVQTIVARRERAAQQVAMRRSKQQEMLAKRREMQANRSSGNRSASRSNGNPSSQTQSR